MSPPVEQHPIDDLLRQRLQLSATRVQRLARRAMVPRPAVRKLADRWMAAAAVAGVLVLASLLRREAKPTMVELEIRVAAPQEAAFRLSGRGSAVEIVDPSGQVMAIVAGGRK